MRVLRETIPLYNQLRPQQQLVERTAQLLNSHNQLVDSAVTKLPIWLNTSEEQTVTPKTLEKLEYTILTFEP